MQVPLLMYCPSAQKEQLPSDRMNFREELEHTQV
jgi:hypothetical protein